jgi:hypothetical protein
LPSISRFLKLQSPDFLADMLIHEPVLLNSAGPGVALPVAVSPRTTDFFFKTLNSGAVRADTQSRHGGRAHDTSLQVTEDAR